MKNKLDALTKHNTVVATITQEMRIVGITESIDNKLGKKALIANQAVQPNNAQLLLIRVIGTRLG